MPVFCALILSTTNAKAQDEAGQTPRPKPTGPISEPTEEDLVRLDKTLEYFGSVEDDAPFIHRGRPITDPVRGTAADKELKAYNYVLAFAHRQPVERLKKYATRDIPFSNLIKEIRADYLRELLHIEGALARVVEMKPTDELKDLSGIERLYDVWIFPNGSRDPVNLVVPELPDGVKLGEDHNLRVAFDAYYFKLIRYETREEKDKSAGKTGWRHAPLFLGRTFEVLGPGTADDAKPFTGEMLGGVVGGLGLLVIIAVGFAIYFRRGDRGVAAVNRKRLEQITTFDSGPDTPGPVNRITDQQ